MSTKSLSLNSFIPQISSTTKTATAVRSGRAAKTDAAPIRRSSSIDWVSKLSALCLVLSVLGLGYYIYSINASVSKGYDLKHEQAIITELNDTQKRLVVQQAALGSIVKVNDLASTAGMVPVTGEEYLVANQLSSR